MNGISHKQAIIWIHRRLDGLLAKKETLVLDEHLHSCDSCRAYAAEMDLLPARLQSEFQARWDKQPGPSQKVMHNVTTRARNIPRTNRILSGFQLLAGAVALIALGFGINFIVSQLQSTSIAGTGTETVNALPRAEDRLLAFASKQNGDSDIYTIHADGSGLTNLTNDPAYDGNPFWSPDGKRIAFESNRRRFVRVYLMDADGSNLIELTNDKADHGYGYILPWNIDGKSNPWSPDGSKLLFLQSSLGGEIENLYVKGINAENQVLLASGDFSLNNISWSPNGKYIAYILNDSPTPNETFVPSIYIVDPDGNNRRELKKLIPQDEYLNVPYYWSSDGRSIVFITDKNDPARQVMYPLDQTLYELDLRTNILLQKGTLKPTVIDLGEEVSLSMDTEQAGLAFVWQHSNGTRNTFDWGDPNCSLDVTRSVHGNFAIGAYCPDSKKFKLFWANRDGSTIRQVLDSPTLVGIPGDIAWSLDDQYVAFTLASDKTSLFILNVEAALNDPSIQPEQIVIGEGELYTIPSWQPIP